MSSMDNAGYVADDAADDTGAPMTPDAGMTVASSVHRRHRQKESQLSSSCTADQKQSLLSLFDTAAQKASQLSQKDSQKESQKKSQEESQQSSTSVQLPRTIGVFSGSAILIGTIIGAGIFIAPAEVLRHAGSPGAALLIWLACGLVEAIGAPCYIELGLLLPEHGGSFTYLLRAFGPLHKFWGEVPAFLQCWLDVNVSNPAGAAVLALTFAQYCVRPWYGQCAPPAGLEPLLAVFVTLTLTATNCIGLHWATRLQTASMFAKMAALAVIVAGGAYFWWQRGVQHLSTWFEGSTTSHDELAAAFFTCMWPYAGWKSLNKVLEEVQEPPRTLPLAIISSLSVVSVLYLVTNVAYLTVLSSEEMLASPAMVLTFGQRALGPAAFLMPLGVALSILGALNNTILSNSRVHFAVARSGHHAHVFSLVHVRWLTPVPALMFQAAVTCTFVLVGDVSALLQLSGFVTALLNVLVLVGLFILRRTMSDAPRPYRVPTVLAVLRLLFSASLFVAPLVQQKPRTEYLYSLLNVVLGLAVYVPCVYRAWSPPLLARGTLGLQKALELLPTSTD